MANVHSKPPWEVKMRPDAPASEQQARTEQSQDIKKREMARGGKWANWERGRKKVVAERRDYFRANPDKTDDFSGV